MKRKFLFVALLILITSKFIAAQTSTVELERGMKITHSVSVTFADYNLDASASLDSPMIIIEGKNITVDFNNSIIHSTFNKEYPDQFRGVVILVRNSKNVTLQNARIHGYKIAVRVENTDHLTIENCNFNYNYRKHLNSTREREDVSDWMSYHNNEDDEWLHYGAGIYLRGCNNAVIQNCTSTHGQCGLMMTSCNNCKVINNNFSFNSGIGIGLYRSSNSIITHNQLDWCVRGFSFGIYNRGEDSAGILVYEQSNNNTFAFNTATHCGDGFFLWAGQSTMESGKGGCNNNLIFANDFSDASNNGVEATFSSNKIIYNRIERCDFGIWAGYSYNTMIALNEFADNKTAIAIEHGQHNQILGNTFNIDKTGVKLWANESQPKDWGYVQKRDTKSFGYRIENNLFYGNEKTFDLKHCDSILIRNNDFLHVSEKYKDDPSNTNVTFDTSGIKWTTSDIEKLRKSFSPDTNGKLPLGSPYQGRENIVMTEWGPYDFQRPYIFFDRIDSGKIYFKILGPNGKWRMHKLKGIQSLSRMNGLVPDTISGALFPSTANSVLDILLELQFIGATGVDEFGDEIKTGPESYYFSYQKLEMPIQWSLNYYKMDTANPAIHAEVFQNAVQSPALKSETVSKLVYTWWNAPNSQVPEDHFAIVAAATQNFPKGNYTFGITADDGVRFYVDGQLFLDGWNTANYKFDDESHHEVTLSLEGEHNFKLEYYEQTGLATLMMSIKKQ